MTGEGEAAKDMFVSFHPISVSLPPSVSQVLLWAASLHWWEWLLMAKAMLLFWVLNITIILPSIYMQVMLYTDEMTSRHLPSSVTLLWEGERLLTLILNPPAYVSAAETQEIRAMGQRFNHAYRKNKKLYQT